MRPGETKMLFNTLRQTKRFFKILFGFTLLAAGIVMIALPAPGALTIAVALGVLAAEFVWAKTLLGRLKDGGMRIRDTFFGHRAS